MGMIYQDEWDLLFVTDFPSFYCWKFNRFLISRMGLLRTLSDLKTHREYSSFFIGALYSFMFVCLFHR